MGNSWQSLDQRAFFNKHLASYIRSVDEGSLRKSFWPKITEEWFETWPLPEPSANAIEKEGLEKAQKTLKTKKVEVRPS